MEDQIKKELIEAVNRDRERRKDPYKPLAEIMNAIHEQGVENEVFELLTQWMIEDRYNKMKRIAENEAIIRAINKVAKENSNTKQAIVGIISLSERE